ncbi:MAG TPA: OmpA family protein [Terriglobales bacterium]|jgi:outer membrane protein OmpA-like peptidoglycan-associated protein
MKRHLYLLPLAATLIVPAAFAQDQTAAPQNNNNQAQSAPANNTPNSSANSNDQAPATDPNATKTNSQYATGAPLQGQQHEGFWGHLQPFARKKYMKKQLDPIRGRVNELDELTAKNSKDIKDVDSRAQKGIQEANAAAGQADQHAQAANQLAQQANTTAQQASTHLQTVSQAVSNIDQYQPVTDAEIRFRPGQTKLGDPAKQALDQIADQLKGHGGYILQVQGFSTTKGQRGITNSQAMAQSVVRYLVEQHDVPLYRIYTVGLGNAQVKSTSANAQNADANAAQGNAAATKRMRGGKVQVTLLKNGIADLTQTAQTNAPANSNAVGATNSNNAGGTSGANLPQNDQGAAQPNANPQGTPKQ